jgi:guanylate kinase
MSVLFVLSSPSGGGKTTIRRAVLKKLPQLAYSISFTTRKARPGEIEGKDYFFISRQSFEEKIKREEFIEWAEVYGNLYGTSQKFIDEKLKKGKDVLLDIDIQGANEIKKKKGNSACLIFLLPPSLEVLKLRLIKRGESEEEIKKRLSHARFEMEMIGAYDYRVVNCDLQRAVSDVCLIITSQGKV